MPHITVRDAVLACLPGTARQIAAKAGCSVQSVRTWIEPEHGTGAHIGDWVLSGRVWTPVWHAGPGMDKAKPAPRNNAEHGKIYRDRIRKAGEYDFHLAKRRALHNADRKSKKKNGWAGALGL